MVTSSPSPKITLEDTLGAFISRDEPGTPLTASEVAEDLDCSRRTAFRKLKQLSDRGELRTKKTGARSRIWWRSIALRNQPAMGNTELDIEHVGEFISAIEDYAIYRLDPEGRIVSWNEGAKEIKGYDENEILGEHYSIFYTDESRERNTPTRNLHAARENGRVEDEGWRIRKNGTAFWANVVITAVYDRNGSLKGYTKVTRDKTDRKYAEDQRRLRNAVSASIPYSESLADGLESALGEVCEVTGWAYGEAWVTIDGLLERAASTEVADLDDETSPDPVLDAGTGIIGSVWQSGKTEFIEDFAAIDEDVLWKTAEKLGFDSALCVPVHADDDVAAILVFAPANQYMDERIMDIIEGVAQTLGELMAKKLAEDALRHERELLNGIFEASPVGIAAITPDSEITRANPRLMDILGSSMDEYTPGEVPMYGADGESIPRSDRPFSRVFESGDPVFDWECQIEDASGSMRWFSINAAPIQNDGRTEQVVVTSEDITSLKEQERDLRQERDFTKRILETVPLSIFVLNRDGEFERTNEPTRQRLGLGESEQYVVGDKKLYDENGVFVPPADRPYMQVFETGEPIYGWEGHINDPDGDWISLTAVPLSDNRDPDQIVVAVNDITKLKEQAHRLEVQRDDLLAELGEVYNRVNDAFFALDREWHFTHLNDRAEQILRRPEIKVLGKRIWDEFPALTESIVYEKYHEAMETQEPVSFERYDEELELWTEINAYPSETGLSVYFRDITEWKEWEQELAQYKTIVETVQEGVYTVNADGRFTMVNEAYAEMTGYPREDLLGMHVTMVVKEETVEAARELEQELVDGKRKTAKFEGDLLTADGTKVRGEATFALLPIGGTEYERVGVVRDVTERADRERKLKRTLDLLGKTEQIADVGGWEIDGDSQEVYWTDHVFDLLEVPYSEAPPLDEALSVYHEADRPIVEDAITDALETGEPFDIEVRARTPRGGVRWLRIRGNPETSEGEVVSLRGAVQDITERKEREKALERYKTVFDTVDDGIYVLGPEFCFAEVNEAYAEMTGYDVEELLGMHCSTVMGEELSDEAATLALSERDSATLEAAIVTKSGERIPGESRFTTLPSDNEFRGSVGIVRNLSDRHAYQRELRRYETLIEESTDVNAIIDANGVMVYVTPSVEYVLGHTQDDLVGDLALDYVHPTDRESTNTEFTALLEDPDERATVEFRFEDANGSWVWLEARARNLQDDPNIEGLVVYTRDITDRKRYELELESHVRKQEAISQLGQYALENPDLDDLFDEAVRMIADVLDTEYCEILDLDQDAGELLLCQGIGWTEGIVGEATTTATENSQAGYTLVSENPVVVQDLETESRFSGPELLISHGVRSGVSTIIGSADDPWGVLGVHDTERRSFTDEDVQFLQSVANVLIMAVERQRHQDKQHELVERLEESNDRLKQFAYIASHDLQEPLRMISSYLQLLENRYGDALDDDAHEFIGFAVDGAERMREMIDDLLAYSRIDTKGKPFELVDSGDIIDRVRANLQVQIDENDATISSGDLPEITGDTNQLEQLFQNLVSNAIKYRRDDRPRIEIEAEQRHGEWLFTVADNGIGMDPGQADRVFDVFERLHTHEEYSGTGIGLALCKKIVRRHGGEIWVESEPGAGSTFYFTIPTTPSVRSPSDPMGPMMTDGESDA